MANNYSQPPYTPEGARARSRSAPKVSAGAHKAGTSMHGTAGKTKPAKHIFRPGLSKSAGPSSGRNR